MKLLGGWLFYAGVGVVCAVAVYQTLGIAVTIGYLGAVIGTVQWRAAHD